MLRRRGSTVDILPKMFKKGERATAAEYEDESEGVRPKTLLTPLTRVQTAVRTIVSDPRLIVTIRDQMADYTESVAQELEYISKTGGVEVGTARIQQLQDVVDKMIAGTDIKSKVVILNKGEKPAAFVLPEGTICISQSLLNVMENLDEVAAVLAHEVNHDPTPKFQTLILNEITR